MSKELFSLRVEQQVERELALEKAEAMMQERLRECALEKKPPRYAALALLRNSPAGQFLVVRRMTEPHVGMFSAVGGKIDHSGMSAGNVKSPLSTYFREMDLETPTEAMLRETIEEVYGGDDGSAASVFSGKTSEELESMFTPQRKCFIYDWNQHAYCAMYTLTLPDQVALHPSPRELGDFVDVSQTKPEEVNVLTRFFLRVLGAPGNWDPKCTFGSIEHFALPEDVLLFSAGKRTTVECPHALREEGYLIRY